MCMIIGSLASIVARVSALTKGLLGGAVSGCLIVSSNSPPGSAIIRVPGNKTPAGSSEMVGAPRSIAPKFM
jgi:hypothetical protein